MEVTPEHPIYVEGKGWLWAENLSIGDRLRRADGGMAKVLAIERVALDEPELVYNFTVKGPHTYFVLEAGVLVHNAGLCGPDGLGLLERYKRSQWRQAGFDVDNPAIQRFIEKSYYPRDVPTNLARNLETSSTAQEGSGFRQWVEQVEKPFLKRPRSWEKYEGLPPGQVGYHNQYRSLDNGALQHRGFADGLNDNRITKARTLEDLVVNDELQEGIKYLYVIDLDGNIRLATRTELETLYDGFAHHSLLAKGENVHGAGNIRFRKGRDNRWVVDEVDPESGHYRWDDFTDRPIPFGSQFKDYLTRRLREHGVKVPRSAFQPNPRSRLDPRRFWEVQ